MARLNAGTVIAAIIAVLLSLSGAFLARQLLVGDVTVEPAPPTATPAQTRYPLPVATTVLTAGRTIQAGDLGLLQLTAEQLAERDLPPIYMTRDTDILGRILKETIPAGEVFAPSDFYPEGTLPPVADALEPGLRAVAITVNDTGFVDGFATPGSEVDVLFRLQSSATAIPSRGPSTYTILEGIRVLAVDRMAFPGSQDDPEQQDVKVTLAVTPQQAAQLKVLEPSGELFLSLRASNERTRDEIQRELEHSSEELAGLNTEAETLAQILDSAAKLSAEFDDKGRQEELNTLIPEKEQLVVQLQEELDTAGQRPEAQSLEQVLQLNRPASIVERLPVGMRAVTVPVDPSGLVDGFAVPGTMVDVLFRLSTLDGRDDFAETTFTILENVQVMAVAQSTEPVLAALQDGDDRKMARVTLAVTPEQATKLKVVEGRGDLSLALRSVDESSDAVAISATEDEQAELANSLDDVRMQLEELQIEEEALQRIQLIAEKRGVPFERQERLQELAQLIVSRQQELAQAEQQASTIEAIARSEPHPQTIADVLGIPAPSLQPTPMPPKQQEMEIYLGGQRKTVVFLSAATSQPSAASDDVGCVDCDLKKKLGPGTSVIRRSL